MPSKGGVLATGWGRPSAGGRSPEAQGPARPTDSPAIESAAQAIVGVVPYVFGINNLAASLTASLLWRVIPGSAGTFAQIGVAMPNRGSIVAIAIRATEAITAGTAKFVPYIEQTPRIEAMLEWATSDRDTASFLPGLATFNADEELDVRVSTPSGFTPVTTDVEVIVYVTFEAS